VPHKVLPSGVTTLVALFALSSEGAMESDTEFQRSQSTTQHGTGPLCRTVPTFVTLVPCCTANFGVGTGTTGTRSGNL
jgi:hypothetical protein